MPIVAALITDTSQLDNTQDRLLVEGTLTFSGSYPTNGDTLDLSQLGIPSNSLPFEVEVFEATPAPGPAYGAHFVFLPGTTQANGLLELFNGTTQIATDTYANILGAVAATIVVRFRAWFAPFI